VLIALVVNDLIYHHQAALRSANTAPEVKIGSSSDKDSKAMDTLLLP
jgi:hypothetical protein